MCITLRQNACTNAHVVEEGETSVRGQIGKFAVFPNIRFRPTSRPKLRSDGLPCKLVRCCSRTRAPGAIVSDPSLTETIAQVPLTFSEWRPLRHLEDPLHKDLSAITRIGDCLFLACDEWLDCGQGLLRAHPRSARPVRGRLCGADAAGPRRDHPLEAIRDRPNDWCPEHLGCLRKAECRWPLSGPEPSGHTRVTLQRQHTSQAPRARSSTLPISSVIWPTLLRISPTRVAPTGRGSPSSAFCWHRWGECVAQIAARHGDDLLAQFRDSALV